MNAGLKLGAYGLILVAVLGAAAAIGDAVGPIDAGDQPAHAAEDDTTEEEDAMIVDMPARGLLVSQDGYTLVPDDRSADEGEFAFTIIGPDGTAVRSYQLLHERELHLIVASRDLRHFVHLHPRRDADGRWKADLPALPPGAYRAFADFQPAGAEQYTLGVDLVAPGPVTASESLAATLTDTVDGYEVTLARDSSSHGDTVVITVRRDGAVVTTEPYLGAAGHLVALRDGDLAYLHVHPLDDEPSGPVRFAVEVPSTGTYVLFFDFQVDATVRTARFVIDATVRAPAGHADQPAH